jgi:hypothetical protein
MASRIFTWTRTAGSPGDWTTPANWDLASGYPGDSIGTNVDTVIIPTGKDKCYVNAAIQCQNLTVSSSQGDWSVQQQNTLAIDNDLILEKGTFNSAGYNLTVTNNLTVKHEGQLDLSGSTLKVASGSNATTYGFVVEDSGKILTGSTGVWYIGKGMKSTSANAEVYFTSGTCYFVGQNTSADRYFELTNGAIYHNKGMLYIKAPDDAEGDSVSGWDTNMYIQWADTTQDSGPWDLVIDIPWDARASPTYAQHTVRPRSDLTIEHYLYLYKGRFKLQYDTTDRNLIVSGMTWMDARDNSMKNGWLGGNQPSAMNFDRSYYRYSRAILDCQGGTVSLGAYPAKGNHGIYDKKTDGSNEGAFQSVYTYGCSSIWGGDSNLIMGSLKANYGDASGSTGYPYVQFSSGTTTFNSKGYNSYSSMYVNIGTYLGNYGNTFTFNTIPAGFYHGSGTLLWQNGYSASIVTINQNDYKNVTIAGNPASGAAQTGYGRRWHWYNVHISGSNGLQTSNGTFTGGPFHIHNEMKIAAGSHLELRGGSAVVEPYAGGFFAERGVQTFISGTLDLRNYGAANYQTMLTSQATTSSWTRDGAWASFDFGSMVIGPSGKLYWPLTSNTKSLAQKADTQGYSGSVVKNNGGDEFNNATFYMFDGGEMHHNSGTMMVSGVTWGEGIEHEAAAGFTGGNAFYNLIISGGNCAPNRDISVIRDFTFNGVAGNYMTPQGAGSTDIWYIGRNFDIKSGKVTNWYLQDGSLNISYVVSGNLTLGSAGATLDVEDRSTGDERYVKVHGNVINKGGKIIS